MISSPSFVEINPSYVMPGVLMNYNQASGAFSALAGEDPLPRLSDGDLYVYVKKMDLRGKAAAGQTAYNELPGISILNSQVSTPTYLLRNREQYDHHDSSAMGRWGVSISDAYRLGARQAMFQQARNALLYGITPSSGEGLMNSQGATAVTLPADSAGKTQISMGYDSGELASFLLQILTDSMSRMYQCGQAQRCVILGPQRLLMRFVLVNIVHLTDFQRAGAGTASTGAMVEQMAQFGNISIEYQFDDTLIGKGAGGTDAILITFPEVKSPQKISSVNTNAFAELMPGLSATNIMLCDMAAPREIPTPMPGGAIDVLNEWRISTGWSLRPEASTIVSMAY